MSCTSGPLSAPSAVAAAAQNEAPLTASNAVMANRDRAPADAVEESGMFI
jgi:hypothetical protein